MELVNVRLSENFAVSVIVFLIVKKQTENYLQDYLLLETDAFGEMEDGNGYTPALI